MTKALSKTAPKLGSLRQWIASRIHCNHDIFPCFKFCDNSQKNIHKYIIQPLSYPTSDDVTMNYVVGVVYVYGKTINWKVPFIENVVKYSNNRKGNKVY